MQKQRLVVIGNGMAGVRTVEEILARGGGERFEIAIFGDEPYGNYNRILLSNVMNGSQAADEIFLNALPWYREHAIKLHVGVRVLQIDRVRKLIFGAGSVVEPYDKLIIATGSRAFIPPIAGMTRDDGELRAGAFGFRTLDDCHAIVKKAQNVRSAAVIGGGLLGLEAARGILHHGAEVHVVHLSAALMNQQLDRPAASMLRKSMEKLGVQVHLEKSTAEVLGDEHAIRGLAFKDGTKLDCEMVVVATGIKPNVELALISGLQVERAIVVDNHMRSSDHDVYAVGECAQHRGMVYGLVAPLWEMAKVLADHITDKDRTSGYYGSKLATKLKVMGVELASMGITEPSEPEDEVVQFSEPTKGRYKKLIIRNGRLVGAIMMGDLEKVGFLMQAFDKNTALPDERLSLLFDLGGPSKKVTYDELPAEAQVCNCNGVSKAMIGASVAAGQRTMKSVMLATRAGMGCARAKGWSRTWWVGTAAARQKKTRLPTTTCPVSR